MLQDLLDTKQMFEKDAVSAFDITYFDSLEIS